MTPPVSPAQALSMTNASLVEQASLSQGATAATPLAPPAQESSVLSASLARRIAISTLDPALPVSPHVRRVQDPLPQIALSVTPAYPSELGDAATVIVSPVMESRTPIA